VKRWTLFASSSFAKAVAAQQAGFHAGEIVPVVTETFELPGYATRGIKLQGKLTEVAQDTHARISPVEVLAKLRSRVFENGVQTGGNSAALVDAAAACRRHLRRLCQAPRARRHRWRVWSRQPCRRRATRDHGHRSRHRRSSLLLARAGLALSDIGRFEINEAQGAQTLSVGRELDLDLDPAQCQRRRHCAGPSAGLPPAYD
jgi:acetyl-CoA C-acetyltransferase